MENQETLTEWVCDTCGEMIRDAEKEGWLEWECDDTGRNYTNYRICHHALASPRYPDDIDRCYVHTSAKKSRLGNMGTNLSSFTGSIGLASLMVHLDLSGLNGRPNQRLVKDISEWSEIFRRLHMPYYEEARQYWREAGQDGYFSNIGGIDQAYFPWVLKDIINRYGDENDLR